MASRSIPSHLIRAIATVVWLLCLPLASDAQVTVATGSEADTVKWDGGDIVVDDLTFDAFADTLVSSADSLSQQLLAAGKMPKRQKRDWNSWRPDPKRALWLSIVIPGAGQIYNRKFWKLPIIYGGFVGCIYALNWNNQMYHDYSQAFIDISDSDPTTESYNQFLHLGTKIDDSNKSRYRNLFKKRKDFYRRYRDLSFFVLLGVYALSVVDAYIDASLSDFDISKDLSVRVAPAVINSNNDRNPLRSSAVGLQCSLRW